VTRERWAANLAVLRHQNRYLMFLRFRDGKVAEWREFSDPDVYRTAVGDHDNARAGQRPAASDT
jgi:ketosteroid isomerase-like protein